MLPIDTLSAAAEDLFRANHIDPGSLYAVLRLDQSPAGEALECFLAIDGTHALLLRAVPKTGIFERLPLAAYREPYVDSFQSACQFLAKKTEGEALVTVSLGCCTNACKTQLFVFLSVLEMLRRGELLTGEEPLFDPLREQHEPERKGSSVMRRMFAYFRPHWWLTFLIFFCLLFEVGADLLRPYLSGKILFDRIISPSGDLHAIEPLFLCLFSVIALAVLRWVSIIVRNIFASRVSLQVREKMRNQLFETTERMSLSFYSRNSTGQILYRIGADVDSVAAFFGENSVSLIIYTVEFVTVAIILFLLNWKLSLFILVPIPLLVLIYRRAFPQMKRLNIRAHRENIAISSRITDSLNGIRVVKAFSKEKEESDALRARLSRLYRVNLQENLFSALLGPSVAMLIYLASQAIWGLGGAAVMVGGMSYGDFCTYLGFVGMVFAPLQFFSNYTTLVGRTAESSKRIVDMLDGIPDVREAPDALMQDTLRGDIDFLRVNFHYIPNRPIIKNLSFSIKSGEHIGVVGHTGSGKSTMASLLTRMYDVTGGQILLDGVDIRRLPLSTIRKNIALVSQEVHIFSGSIADNIRFGRPDASMTEVMNAARAAEAHAFILALPEGYDTMIGSGGRSLSGGERQRISIARALLLNPRILILDEATAAMDNETERRISDAIARLIEGKTSFSIAHRLSSLRDCDRIMAIEGGTLREMGTREELLRQKGIFYKLYTLQNEQMHKVMNGEEEDL